MNKQKFLLHPVMYVVIVFVVSGLLIGFFPAKINSFISGNRFESLLALMGGSAIFLLLVAGCGLNVVVNDDCVILRVYMVSLSIIQVSQIISVMLLTPFVVIRFNDVSQVRIKFFPYISKLKLFGKYVTDKNKSALLGPSLK